MISECISKETGERRPNTCPMGLETDVYQSFKLLQLGLDKFKPPRSSGGSTRPLTMVFSTMDSMSWGVTRPYHTPEPDGVYIWIAERASVPLSSAKVVRQSKREKEDTHDAIASVLVPTNVRHLDDESPFGLCAVF
jgi:hypothetical protein